MRRTNEDKVEMIFLYGQALRNCCEAVRLFNEAHPDRQTSVPYMSSLVKKFTNTFSVKDAPRVGRPSTAISEVNQIYVLGKVAVDPHVSIRKISNEGDISIGSVHKILKAHKFHPYKIKLVQELNDDDPDRRLQFCEIMLNEIRLHGDGYLQRVCFSDECTFSLNGSVSRHNCRYWSGTNPHWFHEGHTQHPQTLNVWAGIYGDRIIGPIFINGTLNGLKYLEMLREDIVPALIDVNRGQAEEFPPIFQQDGAPPHYYLPVREFLNNQFDNRWIGRRGPIEWPARSPDLSPLDFFLWGYVKNEVYKTKPRNIEELKQRIVTSCRIPPQMLQNVRKAFQQRLYYCQETMGAQFEHLL